MYIKQRWRQGTIFRTMVTNSKEVDRGDIFFPTKKESAPDYSLIMILNFFKKVWNQTIKKLK